MQQRAPLWCGGEPSSRFFHSCYTGFLTCEKAYLPGRLPSIMDVTQNRPVSELSGLAMPIAGVP
jgi:hypothetical protein